MRRWRIILILLILIAAGVYTYQNWYVAFKPTSLNKDYHYSKAIADRSFNSNLKKVLTYQFVDFKVKDSVVYIKRKVASDTNLIYNLTNKASDTVWLKNHIQY